MIANEKKRTCESRSFFDVRQPNSKAGEEGFVVMRTLIRCLQIALLAAMWTAFTAAGMRVAAQAGDGGAASICPETRLGDPPSYTGPMLDAPAIQVVHVEGQVLTGSDGGVADVRIFTGSDGGVADIRALSEGDLLSEGDSVYSGDNSGVVLCLTNGVRLVLSQRTVVDITTLDGEVFAPNVKLQLAAGVIATLPGTEVAPNSTFEIALPGGTIIDASPGHKSVGEITLRMPAVMVAYQYESADALVSVIDGTATIPDGDQVVEVAAGTWGEIKERSQGAVQTVQTGSSQNELMGTIFLGPIIGTVAVETEPTDETGLEAESETAPDNGSVTGASTDQLGPGSRRFNPYRNFNFRSAPMTEQDYAVWQGALIFSSPLSDPDPFPIEIAAGEPVPFPIVVPPDTLEVRTAPVPAPSALCPLPVICSPFILTGEPAPFHIVIGESEPDPFPVAEASLSSGDGDQFHINGVHFVTVNAHGVVTHLAADESEHQAAESGQSAADDHVTQEAPPAEHESTTEQTGDEAVHTDEQDTAVEQSNIDEQMSDTEHADNANEEYDGAESDAGTNEDTVEHGSDG